MEPLLGRCAVHVVADHALFRADGVHIDRADEVELHAVPRFVILTEHLVAAADGEKHLLFFNSGADVLALPEARSQQHLLLEVLSAADEENVVLVHIERLTDRALVHIDADAAALQTALHRDNVAPVTVQIENVGVKMADIQFHCSFPLFVERLNVGVLADLTAQVEHGSVCRHKECRCLIRSRSRSAACRTRG